MFYDQQNPAVPQTHALIIGVGGYPHIADGAQPNPAVASEFGQLAQLTSAPRSAARFAQWMVEKADQWDAPLGSLELLVSPAPEDDFELPRDPAGEPPALPTLANVKAAYLAWKERCSQQSDNIAVFYFCGHGGEKNGTLYLLCRDFGAQANIWDGAFNFTKTRDSFHTCAAERQFFFIDACRELTLGLLLFDPTAAPLEGSRKATDPDCRFNFTQFAAPRSQSALGPVRGVSYYAAALMRALEGASAKNIDGQWVVTSGRLVDTLEEISRMQELPEDYDPVYGREINQTAPMLRVPPPLVPVRIECSSAEDNDLVTEIKCHQYGQGEQEWPFSSPSVPWELTLPAEIHEVVARLDQQDPQQAEVKGAFPAEPPFKPYKLRTRT